MNTRKKLAKKEIKAAIEIVEHHHAKKFNDGDFELDGVGRVRLTGDGLGVWVPCVVFVPMDDIQDYIDRNKAGGSPL